MIQGVWVSLDNTLKGENHDKEKSDICSYNYDDADPGGGYTSDEACIWCGATPTKAIKSELDGETVTNYYCEECSTTCFLCGAKATQQFTNESGVDVFLCDDCAADMTE